MTEKPRRHRFQYSLRTLLLLVVLVSVGMSYLAVELLRARRQRTAAEALERAGARVEYDDPLAPLLRRIVGRDVFCEVFAVDASSVRGFGDQEVKYLAKLPTLRALSLADTQITDAGMEHLEGLTNLIYLNLSFTHVTDTGLEHIKDLPHLGTLFLDRTQITGAGVEELRHTLPRCRIEARHVRTTRSSSPGPVKDE